MANVVKRDGTVQPFDTSKIIHAISSAGNVADEVKRGIAESIYSLSQQKTLTVEEIQDLVEAKLMSHGYYQVAKEYIIYRDHRTIEREKKSAIVKKMRSRIEAKNTENSNANVDEKSFSGREKEASADVSKCIALSYGGLSSEVSQAHKDMWAYNHDLEKAIYGVHNCLNMDFPKIFKTGFRTRNGDVRPPKSFSTACQQIAVGYQCQSQVQFGGVASCHLDFDLAPYIRMSFVKAYIMNIVRFSDDIEDIDFSSMSNEDIDDWVQEHKDEYLSKVGLKEEDIYIDNKANLDKRLFNASYFDLLRECKQSAQGLYHNLNTLESRQGSQVPFTSINFGRDTSTEGRLVIKSMLDASIDGIGKYHTTSIFPISVFQYKKGTNADKNDTNYDLKQLAIKSMSKRIYPNWANGGWSQAHEDINDIDTYFATMGCRTLVGYDRHGMGYKRQGRGNNVPVTMILPKLGLEYGICTGKREKADLDGFWKAFDWLLGLTERALLERYSIMKRQSPKSAPFMYQNGTIVDADKCVDTVEESLKHNTLAIGYIGIAEMCTALFGKNHAQSQEVLDFAVSVVKRINEYASEASERNDLNFSCYATPAESLCRTALVALRNQYGVIEGVTSKEYITNSHHVPVWEKVSIYDKLKIESAFCKYPTGGCITYVELPSSFMNNTKAIEDIIDYAFTELDIPYLAFNFPIDTCMNCGYQSEIGDTCPQCGSGEIQRLRRVTGYTTTSYTNFNDGKKAETEDRVVHLKTDIIEGDEV